MVPVSAVRLQASDHQPLSVAILPISPCSTGCKLLNQSCAKETECCAVADAPDTEQDGLPLLCQRANSADTAGTCKTVRASPRAAGRTAQAAAAAVHMAHLAAFLQAVLTV